VTAIDADGAELIVDTISAGTRRIGDACCSGTEVSSTPSAVLIHGKAVAFTGDSLVRWPGIVRWPAGLFHGAAAQAGCMTVNPHSRRRCHGSASGPPGNLPRAKN
jgi:hypothetical protein